MEKRRKPLLDVRHPFFRPLWRRIIVALFLVGWTIFEIVWGSPFWAVLFGGLAAYTIWEFFVNFDPANYEDVAGS